MNSLPLNKINDKIIYVISEIILTIYIYSYIYIHTNFRKPPTRIYIVYRQTFHTLSSIDLEVWDVLNNTL